MIDITEIKLLESTLIDSEEKFSKTFITSPYAIIISQLSDGHICEVNDAFEEITGYSHEEALTKPLVEIDLWLNREERKGVMKELLLGKKVQGKEYFF
jgi:PAS domain S-box-containing protein